MPSPIRKISILGCGWLGCSLAEQLVLAGYEVHGSTTSPEKLSQLEAAGIQPYVVEVGETLKVSNASFFNTDLLFLNIPPGRRRQDVAERYPSEIIRVVERGLEAGIRRLIFISSTSVYQNKGGLLTEEDTPDAVKGSGLALVRCEDYLADLPDLELTLLRLGGLVGGDRKAGRFLAGKKELANGAAPVNMLHREDAVAIIRQLIERDLFGETFNLCADGHPSRRDFYRQQAIKENFEPPTFKEDSSTGHKVISNQKVKEYLDYTFIYPDPMAF